jgi:glycosyltransferase involved in cell wall biosynthesis
MQFVHSKAGTWTKKVHRFIALTDFARRKVIEGGLPADRVVVKPNFMVETPLCATQHEGFALFLGRLSEDKGVKVLLDAWSHLEDVPLNIAGDGPLSEWAQAHPVASSSKEVNFLGFCAFSKCLELLRTCRFLVFPSLWYEGFPLTIRDAFACGRAIIASRIGAAAEIIEDGVTGVLFEPGDPEALARAVRWAMSHEAEVESMGRKARQVFEERYTAEVNYPLLASIYRDATKAAGRTPTPGNGLGGARASGPLV